MHAHKPLFNSKHYGLDQVEFGVGSARLDEAIHSVMVLLIAGENEIIRLNHSLESPLCTGTVVRKDQE